jgi:hypothetical protein
MKTTRLKKFGQSGNALFATVIVTAVVGIALTAYLTMVKNQNLATMRSQAWNNSMPVIEAGIEDALTHLAVHGDTNLVCDSWTQAGSIYFMKRWVGIHYYVVTISNWVVGTTNSPIIESRGFVTMPTVVSAGGPMFAQVSLPSSDNSTKRYLGRGVRAQAKRDFIFSKGLVAQDTIDLNGNNIDTDSFNSMDPSASTNGQYNVNMRRFNGDIASNSQNTSGILVDVGNANIRGTVSTGPGGQVGIGVNGKVGDASWFADSTATGIQSGAIRDDMNVDFKEATIPYTVGMLPMGGNYPIIGGTFYDYKLGNGNFMINELNMNNQNLIVTGNATLVVNNSFNMAGSSSITIAPGGTLKLYIACNNASIGGNGIINNAGYATNCIIYGTPNCQSITVGGNGTFIGALYAPQAALTLQGGGSAFEDFMGAAVVKSAQINGHFKFHYDEALRFRGPPKGFIVVAWNEMAPADMQAPVIDCSDSGVIY